MSADLVRAHTPAPSYAVIVTSKRLASDDRGYGDASEMRIARVERAYGFARDASA